MKKITLFFVAFALLTMYSCKKDVPQPQPTTNTMELSFQVDETDFPGLKNSDEDVPECSPLTMHYAQFEFGGVTYYSDIYVTMDGKILTKAVKIDLGQNPDETLLLENFLIYNDVIPDGHGPEDILLRAAPAYQSTYWDLMENQLNIEVKVEAFVKKEVIVDVLCFEELYYDNFGFTWFEMNKVKIERQCWFGDVCTGKLADYIGSEYDLTVQGAQMDMPAIMKMEVFKNGVLVRTFDNKLHVDGTAWYGEGACMEVYWANDEDLQETFRFDLYVWLPVGPIFDWVWIDSFEFLDENCPDPGPDGVNDFVLGNCQMPDADLIYPAWMNLPPGPITMAVGGVYGPGTQGLYLDVTLSGFADDYDFHPGLQGVFCGNELTHISLNHTYTVTPISSLRVPGSFQLDQVTAHKLNYMFNHIPEIIGAYDYDTPGTNWAAVQDAIWNIVNGKTLPAGGTAEALVDNASGHAAWDVYPGDWAAIFFDAGTTIQPLFIVVDP